MGVKHYILLPAQEWQWSAFSEVCEAVGNKHVACTFHAVSDLTFTNDAHGDVRLPYAWIVQTHRVHPDVIHNLESFEYAPGGFAKHTITTDIIDDYAVARDMFMARLFNDTFYDAGI